MSGRYDFASDTTAPVAPEAMAAITAANTSFTPSYGADPISKWAADLVRGLLDADAEVFFVPSGTGANALSLATLCRPFEAVLAHEHAHVCTDETGAPGLFGQGLGLIRLPGASGRIDEAALRAALAEPDTPHRQAPAALSLTNTTEYGALYDAKALKALIEPARAKGCGVHLDGARLHNAAAAGFDLKAIKDLGVDVLVIGGAKAGMTATEAVVLFDRALARRFDARLKQAGQLPSKGRFFAAPFIGMLETGAYLARAAHANAMARRLADGMPFAVRHPVEANGVFVEMDEPTLTRLRAVGWMIYRSLDGCARFMCSWATTEGVVEEILADLRALG